MYEEEDSGLLEQHGAFQIFMLETCYQFQKTIPSIGL